MPNKTCFLYIHGVTPNLKAIPQGYSKPLHDKLLKELKRNGVPTSDIGRAEVRWAGITHPFKNKLADLQFDSPAQRRGVLVSATKKFIYPAVVDIIYYVKNKGSAALEAEMPIMNALHEEVLKVKEKGYTHCVIFAHSLGSVAAYDYIFRFSKNPQYRFPTGMTIPAFVTFGSPIGLFASAMGYPISTKIERPAYLKRWLNFWDNDDLIANRMTPHFHKSFSKDFLFDYKINTDFLPLKAHTDYWKDNSTIKEMAKHLEDVLE